MADFARVAALLVLVLVIWIVRSPWVKGAFDELRVKRSLRVSLDPDDYQLFSDLMLPARGGTTQIDHIVVSRFGIFIIETKNMSGWIFGGADQPQWTQTIYRFKSRFQNPVRQNYKHIKTAQEFLGVETHQLHGVVAFVGSATPKSAMPSGVVWGTRALAQYIHSKRIAVFDEAELRTVIARISGRSLRSNALTRFAHVRRIKSDLIERQVYSAKCPRCGSQLVERTNRQSREVFLGCSRYPTCKGTRELL